MVERKDMSRRDSDGMYNLLGWFATQNECTIVHECYTIIYAIYMYSNFGNLDMRS